MTEDISPNSKWFVDNASLFIDDASLLIRYCVLRAFFNIV